MNIIDAVDSGRRYKRRGDLDYFPRNSSAVITAIREGVPSLRTIHTDDILADDWEIEPLKLDPKSRVFLTAEEAGELFMRGYYTSSQDFRDENQAAEECAEFLLTLGYKKYD